MTAVWNAVTVLLAQAPLAQGTKVKSLLSFSSVGSFVYELDLT